MLKSCGLELKQKVKYTDTANTFDAVVKGFNFDKNCVVLEVRLRGRVCVEYEDARDRIKKVVGY